MIDTHCHLVDPPLRQALPAVLDRARRAGVRELVVPGTTLSSSVDAIALAEAHPHVHAAVGIHPEAVTGPINTETLAALARHPRVVAIGEIGLDRGPGKPPRDLQEAAFRDQLRLARDLDLPVLVHSRDAAGAVLRALQDLGPGGPGGILHAWAGAREVAEQLAPLGMRFGIAGVACRDAARRVRERLSALPLPWLVLETDAPYIGTARTPKGRVEPGDLPEIRDALAALQGVSPSTVAQVTTATARAVLRLPTP